MLATSLCPQSSLLHILSSSSQLFTFFSPLPPFLPSPLPCSYFSFNIHTVEWVAGSDLRLCAACSVDLPCSRTQRRLLPLLGGVTVAAKSLKWKTEIIQLGSDVRELQSTLRQESGWMGIMDVQILNHGVPLVVKWHLNVSVAQRQKVANSIIACVNVCASLFVSCVLKYLMNQTLTN